MTLNQRDERRVLGAILIVAVLLRALTFNPYSAKHPDELIQYLEQAHRFVFGYGIVPWEFRYGIRSWLIPLLLAGPMALGERIDAGGTLYLILPRLVVMLFNVSAVTAGWIIGRRQSVQHAIVAAAVMATWIECVLFSGQVLSETLATSTFLIAAAIMSGQQTSPLGTASAGAMLGLTVLFRFPYGPAVAAYAVLIAGQDGQRWAMLAWGGFVVMIAGGLIDLAMHQWPYHWLLMNFEMNIHQGRMRGYGAATPWYFLLHLALAWLPGIIIIPVLAARGGRHNRALLVAAVVNLLFHQLFAHKQYRFIWLSAETLVLLAAIGSVDLLRRGVRDHRRDDPESAASTAMLVAAWAATSAMLALTPAYRLHWRRSGASSRLASEAVRDPAVCGLLVPQPMWISFGYAMLHRNKPVYVLPTNGTPSVRQPGQLAQAFNAALSWDAGPPGFRKVACRPDEHNGVCLFRRPGACRSSPTTNAYLMQSWLMRTDQ